MDVHVYQRPMPDGMQDIATCQLASTAAAPASARRATHDFLLARLDAGALCDAQLAASELVTNAVKYGDGSPIWLHLSVWDGRLAITVSSGGSDWTLPLTLGADCDGFDEESGRGLSIVRGLCDQVAVFFGIVTMVRATTQVAPVSRHRFEARRLAEIEGTKRA